MTPFTKVVLASVLALTLLHLFPSEYYGQQINMPHSNMRKKRARPNGVFVIKVMRAEHATKAICLLNRFLNEGPKYPIRIFADYEFTNETMDALQTHANGADLDIIVDTVSWRKLPSTLNETERMQVLENCRNFSTPEFAICTKMVVGLAYVHMGYWRYMHMADEPALEQFEYFVSIDTDAYLTEPMPDPFKIMEKNNLTGIFDVEIHQAGMIANGVQEAAESVFTLEERQNRYLDKPEYQFFNQDGKWHRHGQAPPAIWGFFFGGRLDFFRMPQYKEFVRRIVPFTYTYRTDEQGVVGAAWALLADNDKVWYLPKRGYKMGVYHQGFVDNSQVVKNSHDEKKANYTVDTSNSYTLNTLDQYSNFTGVAHERLLPWEDYVKIKGYKENDTWTTCVEACSKNCNPWVDPRRMPGWVN